MRREVILASAGALLLVACSGDDAAAPSTSGEVTTTSSATTPPTEPTPAPTTTSTTLPTTTSQATTTVPEPTAPPTSDQPATTQPEGVPPRVTFPDDPEKQAVVDAAYDFFDAADAVSSDPSNERLRAEFRTTVEDPLESRFIDFLDELVDGGEYIAPRPATRVEILKFTVDVLETSGTFDVCAVSANVRMRIGGSGEEDVIVNDEFSSALQTYTLALVDGVWRVKDIERYARFEGQLGCD